LQRNGLQPIRKIRIFLIRCTLTILNLVDHRSIYPRIAWAQQFAYVDVPENMRVSMI